MQKRKAIGIVIAIFILALSTYSNQFKSDNLNFQEEEKIQIRKGQSVLCTLSNEVSIWNSLMEKEISSGNLKLASTQIEDFGFFAHQRYDLYYQGIKVWGAQLIRHLKNGQVYCINGRYYDDIQISVSKTIEKEKAFEIAKKDFSREIDQWEEPELIIFPTEKEYYLAYQISLVRFDCLMVYFVNAWTGEIILKYNDVKTDAAIGLGTGTLADQKKMSTEFKSSTYYSIDIMRPAKLTTANSMYTQNINKAYYMTDSDNYWTDGAAVDAHAYLGWIYDYYYLVHNRKGINNANQEHVICVHLGVNYENAFFHPSTGWIYFGDGNPNTNYPYSTALDVVAHEFTHGVTEITSKLIYLFESGALNEAFSDILGVSCEFFHQPTGTGYLHADWWEGEDCEKVFKAGRDLSDPSSVRIYSNANYRYPDHYAKRYILASNVDNGGVHINSTIGSHWYYLLANGGTNKTSGISVSGISVSKAEKIAYRALVYYLHPSSNFASARSATYQAAVDIYGAGSTEALRVAEAWNAVGVK